MVVGFVVILLGGRVRNVALHKLPILRLVVCRKHEQLTLQARGCLDDIAESLANTSSYDEVKYWELGKDALE
jgi:hypothetical protein